MLFNIWVTRACNLNCKYCYEGSDKHNEDFSEKNINNVIQLMKDYGGIKKLHWINFHGGEPLIKFYLIKEIISKIERSELQVHYSFTTNGILLNDNIINEIIKNKIEITLSIDGDKETHDLYRVDKNGKGTYDIVMLNMKKLIEKSLHLRIRMTFDSKTVSKLFDNVQHLILNGGKTIIIVPDLFDKNWTENEFLILEEQLKLLKTFINNYKTYHHGIYVSMIEKEEIKKLGTCYGGINELNIDCNGELYPCTYVVSKKQFAIGNIQLGLEEKILDNLKCIYNKKNEQCIGCNYIEYCLSSRCKYLNYVLTGNLCKTSATVCAIENAKIHSSFKLENDRLI